MSDAPPTTPRCGWTNDADPYDSNREPYQECKDPGPFWNCNWQGPACEAHRCRCRPDHAQQATRMAMGADWTGRAIVTLTPPPTPAVLGDGAMWTCVAVLGPWASGPVMRYAASNAVAGALEALGAAVRAAFPVRHGWAAPAAAPPPHLAAHGGGLADWVCDGTVAGCQCACIFCHPDETTP